MESSVDATQQQGTGEEKGQKSGASKASEDGPTERGLCGALPCERRCSTCCRSVVILADICVRMVGERDGNREKDRPWKVPLTQRNNKGQEKKRR